MTIYIFLVIWNEAKSIFLFFLFFRCPLVNISYCSASEIDLSHGKNMILVIYDSLGWRRDDVIRIPVGESVEQSYSFYRGYNGTNDKAPHIPQNAGAYIFRPNGTFLIKPEAQVPLTVMRGPLIVEVHQKINQWMYQIRDYRTNWNLEVNQPVARNYYPINLGIYTQDSKKEFSILVDRPFGGSSIVDGQIELMLYRSSEP
ncbi:hypothetical protein Dsin_030134 [Dipteronia sinensis]|uniref:Glycosyl hydrolase family 38 C-terminal domain-containing protein n=1 Tax=Dipteronia sinensis TaxID=43782 RepID=A0AAD9ZJE4_9ROSI|nr:hypothetical protein Dsin_030134 [Dipteronia sinensis]